MGFSTLRRIAPPFVPVSTTAGVAAGDGTGMGSTTPGGRTVRTPGNDTGWVLSGSGADWRQPWRVAASLEEVLFL